MYIHFYEEKKNKMALTGCRRCMTCNDLKCTQYRVFWPGFTDTCMYFMLARRSMAMTMMSSDAKWTDKKQETTPLAERRNVKLSLKIPSVLGTGLINDQILYVRTIEHITGSKSPDMSPIQLSPTGVLNVENDDVQTPEMMWEDDSFMFAMFF